MERKIGEVFELDGVKLRVEKGEMYSCVGCYFNDFASCQDSILVRGYCVDDNRRDQQNVIFTEVKE